MLLGGGLRPPGAIAHFLYPQIFAHQHSITSNYVLRSTKEKAQNRGCRL
ncbi:MAG: hypothetical protein HWQ23_07630 [Nostoc sp. JL33]|nr:hypothetical protein [Nostoc sp. JL33]MBN3870157.1 hypothetical protein [Nostoc sp. JL33]